MNYLLDSHIFLWSIFEPEKLDYLMTKTITNVKNEIYISSISLWEIALKYQLGKLKIDGFNFNDIFDVIKQQGYKVLSLNSSNCENLMKLPFVDNHKDPFDRMLISQAIEYDFTLISKDGKFNEYKNYGLKLL